MNQMSFDEIVQTNPEEFFHIRVPKKELMRVPNKGVCYLLGNSEAYHRSSFPEFSVAHVYHVYM